MKIGLRGFGTLHEQCDAVSRRQRWQSQNVLTGKAQNLTRRDHEAGLLGAVQPSAQRRLGMPCHLLEVVEDHQAAAAPGDGIAELHDRIVAAERNVETLGHRAHQSLEAARGRQIAEPDAAWKFAEPASAIACHQPRLACAADAEYRHEAHTRPDEPGQRVQCVGASDEGVVLGWQAVPDLAHR